MVRYRGPKYRKLKAFGVLPGLKICKTEQKLVSNLNQFKKLKKKSSAYSLRLKEKQKIRYNYGISETQLYSYVKKFQYFKNKGQNLLLTQIELRLDTIVYSFGFTKTIASARQLINHGKVFVNSNRVSIASFICKIEDIIFLEISKEQKEYIASQPFFIAKLPNHLIKLHSFCGQIINDQITKFNLMCEERLVFEFYAKR